MTARTMNSGLQKIATIAAYQVGSLFSMMVELIVRNRFLRVLAISGWYVLVTSLAYSGAFFLRFDGNIPLGEIRILLFSLPVLILVRIVAFKYLGLYSGLLHYVSVDEVWRTMKAIAVSTFAFAGVIYLATPRFQGFPRSVLLVEMMLSLGILSCHRMALRAIRERAEQAQRSKDANNGFKRILIVGALHHADTLLRDGYFSNNGNKGATLLGIVNDNPLNQGKRLRRTRIIGPTHELPQIVSARQPHEVLILPPFNMPKELRRIVDACKVEEKHLCKFKMVPSLSDIAQGKISVSMIRNVQIEDLLGRAPVKLDRTEVEKNTRGNAVMVTGAGGSIGSELSRQIAHYGPSRLVLFELNEYNLYSIERELSKRFPELELVSIAGDVCDERRLLRVLHTHCVDTIYHAAAYKHVPLMEKNPAPCLRTNVIGTETLARAAERQSVKKFVFISSDKAVRPTSLMGASKRLAERLLQERAPSRTKFVAVRFGNVLDSSGSVIPLFREQLREGGPITVTHPEITRFFMSIPEAVDLVLQAATIGDDREIMVLEMGQPIRIRDLATRLIEFSGLRPGIDIKIEYTGLRPGEKLYEELLTEDDNVVRTEHNKIWVMRSEIGARVPAVPVELTELQQAIEDDSDESLRKLIQKWIPEGSVYHSRESAYRTERLDALHARDNNQRAPRRSPPIENPVVNA